MKAALTEDQIKNLEEKGFSRWTKGDYDRLYINAGKLGLECGYYNTGNIRSASFDGESISNSRARRMKAAKTFLDEENISDWAVTSVSLATANGFIDGMDDNTFRPADSATRAQAATIILRVMDKENKV